MMNGARIGIYLLLTSILLGSLNYYVSSTVMYKSKTEKIDMLYKELGRHEAPRTTGNNVDLVIGNSYVAASFNPDNEGDDFVLFTVSGMPMVDMLGIIEHLPEATAVKTVLVGLGYNYATPVGGTSSSYDLHFTANPLRKAWASIPLVRGRSIASTALKEDVKCIFAQFVPMRCSRDESVEVETDQGERAEITPYNPTEHLKQLHISTRKRYKQYLPFTSQLSDSFLGYLLRMQEACKRRNIQLFAYTAPIYSELRQKLPSATLDKFRAAVAMSGIEYVDLNMVFPHWGAKAFSDATHVSKTTSGRKTTEYLLDFIGANSAH
jgi:hypothetical protein